MTYSKPLFAPVTNDRESAGCCFYYNNAGQGFYYYGTPPQGVNPQDISLNGILNALQGNSVVSVGNNGAGVTPLCNSGLPATQPQTFGLPVGVTGVQGTVTGRGCAFVSADGDLGASVAGQQVALPASTTIQSVAVCLARPVPVCIAGAVCTG